MKIIAHRGASKYAPENTISSFRKAIDLGCDGIELDVHLTLDNKLVVYHDYSLGRTSSGEGFIKDLTLEYIKEQDAGSWFSTKFAEEKIPTLEEVLDVIPKSMLLIIEIKAIAMDERKIGNYVVDILNKRGRIESTIISSFNHNILKDVQKISKEIKLGALMYTLLTGMENYLTNDVNYTSVHLSADLINEQLIMSLLERGIKTFVWTINDKYIAEVFRDLSVEGIITNIPDIFK